jgi:hypothetical protein
MSVLMGNFTYVFSVGTLILGESLQRLPKTALALALKLLQLFSGAHPALHG